MGILTSEWAFSLHSIKPPPPPQISRWSRVLIFISGEAVKKYKTARSSKKVQIQITTDSVVVLLNNVKKFTPAGVREQRLSWRKMWCTNPTPSEA